MMYRWELAAIVSCAVAILSICKLRMASLVIDGHRIITSAIQLHRGVVVNPFADTNYYLKAEKFPGCFAFDTVHVHVSISPSIHLGNDTSFCNGSTITLDAGGGFSLYQWNNGATTQKIAVAKAGGLPCDGNHIRRVHFQRHLAGYKCVSYTDSHA